MPIWIRRNLLALTACLAVTLALVQPGSAQEGPTAGEPTSAEQPAAVERPAAVTPPATTEPAPEAEANKDKTVAAFSDGLKLWTDQIKALEHAIADGSTTDEELRAIPEFLETLREAILEQRAVLKPKLQDMRDRLAKLGPAPKKDGPEESAEIAAQRKRLEADVAAIDGKLKQADILSLRADQLVDAANDKRRERFTESLFGPVPNFYSNVLPTAFERLPLQFKRLFDAGAAWIARAWAKGSLVFILLFLVQSGPSWRDKASSATWPAASTPSSGRTSRPSPRYSNVACGRCARRCEARSPSGSALSFSISSYPPRGSPTRRSTDFCLGPFLPPPGQSSSCSSSPIPSCPTMTPGRSSRPPMRWPGASPACYGPSPSCGGSI